MTMRLARLSTAHLGPSVFHTRRDITGIGRPAALLPEGDGGHGDGGAPPAGDPPAGDPPAAGGDGAQQQAQQTSGSDWDGKVESLPEGVQTLIRDLRRENGTARTTAKQQAADDARNDLAQKIGVALGIVKDDKEQVDPAKLTADLTAAQANARESAAELVVWRAAAELKVDAQAVTDSRAFARAVQDLDPSANDFAKKVKAAALEAAENNPKLKAVQAAGASGAEFTGGSGGGANQPTTLDEAIAKKMAR